MKTCSKCKETKELTGFSKHNTNKDGLQGCCKLCLRIYNKNYRRKHLEKCKEYRYKDKEKRKERDKKYYEKNKEQFKIRAKRTGPIYYKNNKEKIIKRMTSYNKNRAEKDNVFALMIRIRKLISISIRGKGYGKRASTHEILGCSFEDFKLHIERQFTKGMSWDNRDKWHIDHIIPMSTAKTEEDVIRLNHYTNLRPLWAEENLSKSDKIITHQLVLL